METVITRVSIESEEEFRGILEAMDKYLQKPTSIVISGSMEIWQEIEEHYTEKGAREFKPSNIRNLTLKVRYKVEE